MTLSYPPPFQDLATLAEHVCCTPEEILAAIDRGEFPKPERHKKGQPFWRWDQVSRTFLDTTHCVYFAEALDFIKIGFSTNVGARMEDISQGLPCPVKLLHTIPGNFNLEANLHRKFAHLRANGEWFRKAPELVEYIESLRAQE